MYEYINSAKEWINEIGPFQAIRTVLGLINPSTGYDQDRAVTAALMVLASGELLRDFHGGWQFQLPPTKTALVEFPGTVDVSGTCYEGHMSFDTCLEETIRIDLLKLIREPGYMKSLANHELGRDFLTELVSEEE